MWLACAVSIILGLDFRSNPGQAGLEIHQHIVHIEEYDMVKSVISLFLHLFHVFLSNYKVKDLFLNLFSFTHGFMTKMSKEQIEEEIRKTDEIINDIIGTSPTETF
jgi:hypothetical protein